jgi:hypothetical protein
VSDLFQRWHRETGDGYVLGIVRVALGCLLAWHALASARELLAQGYFGDGFHMPWIPERFVLPRTPYTVLTAARMLAAVLVVVGHRARPALLFSALAILYVILCDRLEYHHNRWALAVYSFLLAFAPCDRSYLLLGPSDEPLDRTGPLWAQRLAQLQVSLIYLASGGSKLLDTDWRDGLVIADRIHRYGHVAVTRGVPEGLVSFFGRGDVSSAVAKVAIMTELLLAVGLWSRRARVVALWCGVWFHLTIQATSNVEVFTWLALATYGLFVTPDYKVRRLRYDPARAKGRVLALLARSFDWLGRFEVKAWEPDDIAGGHSIVIVRRDGTPATGVRALAMAARCLPVLFPIWAPLALVASFTKGGEASAGV